MKIKLSDFVIEFLKAKGVKTFFTVSGGASLHLINSVKKNNNLRYVCNHHEQAAACAADGYARTRNDIGCAIVTSGPGATNLITGIASSFFDSIPVSLDYRILTKSFKLYTKSTGPRTQH